MKFTVRSLVSSVNASQLSEAEAVTREIVVANPKATIQNLRAVVAIQFRLNVVAFDFRFDHRQQVAKGAAEASQGAPPNTSSSSADAPADSPVDFSDEKKPLAECGLEEGDHLLVVPKSYQPPTTPPSASAAAAAALLSSLQAEKDGDARAAKKPRVEGEESGDDIGDASLEEEEEDEEDEEASEDDVEASAQNDLFEALRDVVPDLAVLRQEFLANPHAVMERIERNHPSLFQVITQNQETFITLMNNEQLTKAAQSMLHGGSAFDDGDDEENSLEWSMGEEDEEADEQMLEMLQDYISNGGGGQDFNAADLTALEASGMQVGDVEEGGGGEEGSTRKSDKEFSLARVPTEEDEKKIQALTELGFTYEQCKVAFYMCHRSIDRASNMLFEAPPEL